VNAKYVAAFHTLACAQPVPCLDCVGASNPSIGARCESGHCQVFDVGKVPEITGCTTGADCRLRKGLDCCECGGSGAWVAVKTQGEAALSSLVCAADSACDECLPVPPAGLIAGCSGGICQVESSD
jgi:hypothetical protein